MHPIGCILATDDLFHVPRVPIRLVRFLATGCGVIRVIFHLPQKPLAIVGSVVVNLIVLACGVFALDAVLFPANGLAAVHNLQVLLAGLDVLAAANALETSGCFAFFDSHGMLQSRFGIVPTLKGMIKLAH